MFKWGASELNKGYNLTLPVIVYFMRHIINEIYFKTFIFKEVMNIYSPETKETVHIK